MHKRAPKYMKKSLTELKKQFYYNSWRLQYSTFNNGQNIQTEEIENLNNSINQIHLTDRQNTPSNISRIYILLKCTWNILQDSLYVRLQNLSQNNLKVENIFSDHNGIISEINNRRKTEKFTNMWKLTHPKPMGQRKTSQENQKILDTN